jgi:hypothetical protein
MPLNLHSKTMNWFKRISRIMPLSFYCCAIWTATALASETISFDDLSARTFVQNGYGGLQWNNFNVVNGYEYPGIGGYWYGMISASNTAVNAYANPAQLSSTLPFDLESAYLTAAWVEGLQVKVQGFIGSSLKYDNTYILSQNSPSLLHFDYLGVSEVRFMSLNGGANGHFAVDNLIVTVPEPCATSLILFSTIIFALGERRSNQGLGANRFH